MNFSVRRAANIDPGLAGGPTDNPARRVCPHLRTGHATLDRAFRIALGDFFGNIQPWSGDPREQVAPCILAGLDYDKPWTRDAAFNAWYAGTIITPGVARQTLLAVLTRDGHGWRIGGEYWDAILWTSAAWHHYLATGDRAFLATAHQASRHSLDFFERTERDPEDGLFRGGACFQDGVSGYPAGFADGPTSGIADWVKAHPRTNALPGHGLPMKALSTNALYYHAYRRMPDIEQALGLASETPWSQKADELKQAIQRRFWNPRTGTFRYLVDAGEDDQRQEGFGHAFVLLFGIADDAQVRSVFAHQVVTPHGIPCVWPTYERYRGPDGTGLGRHSGTVWPQVNAAWVMACVAHGRRAAAWQELNLLADKAVRDNQFAELYHPISGAIHGGRQEWWDGSGIREWPACQRQTWCATGFLNMILSTLFGLRLEQDGLHLDPWLPPELKNVQLSGLLYRGQELNLTVERGNGPAGTWINGNPATAGHLNVGLHASQHVVVRLDSGG
jgi:glycogen debranching enzyme